MSFYNWDKVFSYNADLNMIITARGKGKTYGLRKQCIRDFLKDGSRFAEIVRYNNQIKDVADGYFHKIEVNEEFPEYEFKTEGSKGYIRKRTKDNKEKWLLLCYFVSLNAQQNEKKKTYVNVKRVIFDEFILERRSFPGYLPGEYRKLVNLIDTLAREIPGEGTKVKIYLLSNACDLVNPYFQEFGIKKAPREGFTWLDRGVVLLHYDNDPVYTQSKRETLVGRLSRGHNEDMITNVFSNANSNFIEKKTKNAKFNFAFVYNGETFAVWVDYNEGYYYINGSVPNNETEIYSLTREDNSPNLLMAKRQEHKLNSLIQMFYNGLVRYETPAKREGFLKMAGLFGVR